MAIGYERRGQLQGGVVFTQYTVTNITITSVLEAPLTRKFMRAIYLYPFMQLKVKRVTALVDKLNTASRRLVEHDGYIKEGCLREAAANGDDVIVYGLLRKDCRWLTP